MLAILWTALVVGSWSWNLVRVRLRQRMEQTLIRSERFLVASELSAGMCHNLNNILTTILGPAMMLKRKIQDPKLLQDIETIISSSNRAADLVRQLHAMER